MILNVQITMTNVIGCPCLIHDFSIHSEIEACIQAKVIYSRNTDLLLLRFGTMDSSTDISDNHLLMRW